MSFCGGGNMIKGKRKMKNLKDKEDNEKTKKAKRE
jgi:hypothetical protein